MRCHVETALTVRLGREPLPGPGGELSGTFDSPLPLRVHLREPGECTVLLGETPTADGAGVPVPAGPHWGVEPANPDLDDAGLSELAGLLRERRVPGLHLAELPRITHRGLSSLDGLESLRWLSFDCCWNVPGAEGLPVLRSLPALTDLDLGSHSPRADELGSLVRLEALRASCAGLSAEAFEALGSCPELRFLDLGDAPVEDADMALLPPMPRLEEFHLGSSNRTAAILSQLHRHESLRCVGLGDLPLDAAAIADLARLPRLEHLHEFRYTEREEDLLDLRRLGGLRILDGYPVLGPRELPHVAQLPLLEELNLDGAEIGDEDLSSITALRALRCLVLRNTRTTDAGLHHLDGLRRIEALDLSLTTVTDAGLKCLKDRRNLRWLGLDLCTGVTGRGLAHLPADSALAEVSASGSGFDATGMAMLKSLPALRQVDLNRTKVSPDVLEEFRRTLGSTGF